ncbi:MAG: hypothetical protein M1834_001952 [Cirrosporium novae-zelandiae]|nr:MAG: hypothetical protein M1834_001952 [Cirrosporium novae-zelandiae]
MSIIPIITFKAGVCNMDNTATPPKVVPRLTPGYLYLYEEDELIHFCWRPRVLPVSEAHVDLVMVPGDGAFVPYEPTPNPSTNNNSPPTNGRIYVLKFLSSSQRHLFWLQSKSQHPSGNPSWFSPRDLKLGQIVNQLLQGEEVNVAEELATAGSGPSDGDDDGDATMEDAETATRSGRGPRGGSGGAGPGATGGDIREEGEESREGGADGARA